MYHRYHTTNLQTENPIIISEDKPLTLIVKQEDHHGGIESALDGMSKSLQKLETSATAGHSFDDITTNVQKILTFVDEQNTKQREKEEEERAENDRKKYMKEEEERAENDRNTMKKEEERAENDRKKYMKDEEERAENDRKTMEKDLETKFREKVLDRLPESTTDHSGDLATIKDILGRLEVKQPVDHSGDLKTIKDILGQVKQPVDHSGDLKIIKDILGQVKQPVDHSGDLEAIKIVLGNAKQPVDHSGDLKTIKDILGQLEAKQSVDHSGDLKTIKDILGQLLEAKQPDHDFGTISNDLATIKDILGRLEEEIPRPPHGDTGSLQKQHYDILSAILRENGDFTVDDILGTVHEDEKVVNNITTAYVNWQLCKTGDWGHYNDGKTCTKDVGRSLVDLVPACAGYVDGGVPSAECELSLVNATKKCLDNKFCLKCEEENLANKKCKSTCNYRNYQDESKFTMRPYCNRMLDGLKEHYPNRKFFYGLARVNLCSTETCRQREFNSLSKYKPAECLKMSFDDNTYSLSSECQSKVQNLSSVYQTDCNDYFSDIMGFNGLCEDVLPNTTTREAEPEVVEPEVVEPEVKAPEPVNKILQSAYDALNDCMVVKKVNKRCTKTILNTFFRELNGEEYHDQPFNKQPCFKYYLAKNKDLKVDDDDNKCKEKLKNWPNPQNIKN